MDVLIVDEFILGNDLDFNEKEINNIKIENQICELFIDPSNWIQL